MTFQPELCPLLRIRTTSRQLRSTIFCYNNINCFGLEEVDANWTNWREIEAIRNVTIVCHCLAKLLRLTEIRATPVTESEVNILHPLNGNQGQPSSQYYICENVFRRGNPFRTTWCLLTTPLWEVSYPHRPPLPPIAARKTYGFHTLHRTTHRFEAKTILHFLASSFGCFSPVSPVPAVRCKGFLEARRTTKPPPTTMMIVLISACKLCTMHSTTHAQFVGAPRMGVVRAFIRGTTTPCYHSSRIRAHRTFVLCEHEFSLLQEVFF